MTLRVTPKLLDSYIHGSCYVALMLLVRGGYGVPLEERISEYIVDQIPNISFTCSGIES